MKEVRALIAECAERGIVFRVFPDKKRLNARPKSALTDELAERIKAHKAEIMAAMREDGIIRSEADAFAFAEGYFGLERKGVRQ